MARALALLGDAATPEERAEYLAGQCGDDAELRRTVENLLDAAVRGGFQEVWLETNSVLTEAITLYRKYGFEPVPSEHLLPRCDQAYLLRLAEYRSGTVARLASRQSAPPAGP